MMNHFNIQLVSVALDEIFYPSMVQNITDGSFEYTLLMLQLNNGDFTVDRWRTFQQVTMKQLVQ